MDAKKNNIFGNFRMERDDKHRDLRDLFQIANAPT